MQITDMMIATSKNAVSTAEDAIKKAAKSPKSKVADIIKITTESSARKRSPAR